MCGIAGLINYQNQEMHLKKMLSVIAHRGPDAEGVFYYNNLALGHRRLSIIDLDQKANQPMLKHNLVIVFNGEIYNFLELKQKIVKENKNINFNTNSDTEVILELYNNYGVNAFKDLRGMFSFALLDKSLNKLYLVRDSFGIKPFFYVQKNNNFAFSSELKSLINLPNISKEIDTTSLVSSINYLWISAERSILKDIVKITPGTFIEYNLLSNKTKIISYSEFNISCCKQQYTENEYLDQLDDIFIDSIKKHLIADVPVASFLSGGLDSSLISVLASKYSDKRLTTFTMKLESEDMQIEKMSDDAFYAKKLAEKYNFDHHEIVLKPNLIKELPNIVYALDEPIGDPAAINTYLISKAAKEIGIKVLLSGMGADELFGGYRRHLASMYSYRFMNIPYFLRNSAYHFSKLLPVKLGSHGFKSTRWLRRFLSFASLKNKSDAYMRSYSYYDKSNINNLFSSNLLSDYKILQKEHEEKFNRYSNLDDINKMCYTDISMFMLGLNLTYTDRATMLASVEARVPFVDKKVAEFAMTIPGSLKIKNSVSKYILKKYAEKYLDKEIIYRPKASFGMPIRSWMSASLFPLVNDLLSEKNVKRRNFFNYKYINKLILDDKKGISDNAYQIYQLLTFELWCRNFLD